MQNLSCITYNINVQKRQHILNCTFTNKTHETCSSLQNPNTIITTKLKAHKYMTESYGTMTSLDGLHFHSSPEKLSLNPRRHIYENLFLFEHKKESKPNTYLSDWPKPPSICLPFNYNVWCNIQYTYGCTNTNKGSKKSIHDVRKKLTRSRLQYPKRLLPSSPVSMKEKVSLQQIKDSHH